MALGWLADTKTGYLYYIMAQLKIGESKLYN